MTDLEFYQNALSCQSWLVNRISEIKAYGKHWGDELCLKEIRDAIENYLTDDYVKEVFTLDNLTRERAKHLRFGRWDEDEQPDLFIFPSSTHFIACRIRRCTGFKPSSIAGTARSNITYEA